MLYTDLSKTSSVIINSGAEHIVYFNVETADEPADHGTGGKSILSASEYTGLVNVAVTTPDSLLTVMTRHETTAGVIDVVTAEADVYTEMGGAVLAAPVTGSVPSGKNLTVVLRNASPHTVTVTRVDVRLLSQAI